MGTLAVGGAALVSSLQSERPRASSLVRNKVDFRCCTAHEAFDSSEPIAVPREGKLLSLATRREGQAAARPVSGRADACCCAELGRWKSEISSKCVGRNAHVKSRVQEEDIAVSRAFY